MIQNAGHSPGIVLWPGRRAFISTCKATVRGVCLYHSVVRTERPRLVRVPSTYSTWGPGGKPPCAYGTYPTREAGTRRPYVPCGGAGAYVSAYISTIPEREKQNLFHVWIIAVW